MVNISASVGVGQLLGDGFNFHIVHNSNIYFVLNIHFFSIYFDIKEKK